MSEGSIEGPQEDPELQVTPIQRRPVKRKTDTTAVDDESKRQQEAEKEREATLAAEAAQANHREIADLVERNQAYIQHAVEMAKINAKKREERDRIAIPVDGDGKPRDPAVMDRKATAKVTMALIIAFVLLVIVLIIAGLYIFVVQSSPNIYTGRSLDIITSTASPVADPNGGSNVEDKTRANPAASSANLSGGALPGNSSKPTVDSDTHIEGNIVSPANPSETGPVMETDAPTTTDKDSQKFDP